MGAERWTDERLDLLRAEGDPPGDEVVARFFAERSSLAPRECLGLLVRHGDVPEDERSPALAAYLDDEPPLPSWVDAAQIKRGEDVFCQWGPLVGASLFCAALPEAYAGAKGVQVLHLTARLATDPRRRIYETAQMLIDAMAPGGLQVGARGYREARRVRLMHAAVRHLIEHDPAVAKTCDPSVTGPHWCHAWGVPVNQEDLLGTLMTFTVVVFDGLRRLGVPLSDDDAGSYLHAWSVVGHLIGIGEDLLPLDLADAEEAWAAIRKRQTAHSPEGVEMTAALVGLLQQQMPPGLHHLPPTLIRYLVGDEVADLLAVAPPSRIEDVGLSALRRATALVGRDAEHDRVVRRLGERLGRLMLEAFLVAERGGRRAAFTLPDELADRWGVARPGPDAAPTQEEEP
jgi:hypothetical protein